MKRVLLLGSAGGLLALLGALGMGCGQQAPAPDVKPEAVAEPWFTDVTEEVGLDFVHDPGPPGSSFMPQIMGSGAAFFDFDGDGRLDLYLLQNGGPKGAKNRLYRQDNHGHFLDVSAGSGLDVTGYSMGVAVGDVNNDGRPDVFLTQYGGIRLFLNKGGGTFADVTEAAGLRNPAWGTSAAFLDYDRDGWLDLVVVNYVDYDPSLTCEDASGHREYCPPRKFPGTVARLYHHLGRNLNGSGDSIRFEEVTLKSGLGRLPGPGLGVGCADFNGDGWPDIFIANDAHANHLWINRHDGTFAEEALSRGVAYNVLGVAQANMGVALGDVDGDGLLDLFVTHLGQETHTLWRQGPSGFFRDGTAAAGLTRSRWHGTGFGTVLADFDHDGAPDLAVVNGRIARNGSASAAGFFQDYAERNQLFVNDGSGGFEDVSLPSEPFCATAGVFRGLACGDLDGDGAPDLVVTAVGGRARLYRNVAPKRGHWLLVRALDPVLQRDAYGAAITVHAGGRTRVSWINPASSYLCSNDPRAHFGLGPARSVDRIRVAWPDGTAEDFPGRSADQMVVLRKGEGRAAPR